MSFAIDSNVLIYASDTRSPFHAPAARLLDDTVGGADLLFLAWPVIFAYLRVVTHSAVLAQPLRPQEAESNIDRLLALPNVRILPEDASLWDTYRNVTGEIPTRGNLVSDVHLAALLRHHGIRTLYTNDSDFRRFRFLDLRNPFR